MGQDTRLDELPFLWGASATHLGKVGTIPGSLTFHAIENKLTEELEHKQQEIDALREQVNALDAKFEELNKSTVEQPGDVQTVSDAPNFIPSPGNEPKVKVKRRPGRPRKNPE